MVLFRGECRRCLSSVKFQKGEAVVTEQTFFWRRSRLFDKKQPKPDLAVPISSVVACRESFLGKEKLLLLSLRSGEQLRFCSNNFFALWLALHGALGFLKNGKDVLQPPVRPPIEEPKTKTYTSLVQQRAEQAARRREEVSRRVQEERMQLQKQRPLPPRQEAVSPRPKIEPSAFCPWCGQQADPADRFCLCCGGRLAGPGKEGEKD